MQKRLLLFDKVSFFKGTLILLPETWEKGDAFLGKKKRFFSDSYERVYMA